MYTTGENRSLEETLATGSRTFLEIPIFFYYCHFEFENIIREALGRFPYKDSLEFGTLLCTDQHNSQVPMSNDQACTMCPQSVIWKGGTQLFPGQLSKVLFQIFSLLDSKYIIFFSRLLDITIEFFFGGEYLNSWLQGRLFEIFKAAFLWPNWLVFPSEK